MSIFFDFFETEEFLLGEDKIKKWINTTVKKEDKKLGEINVVFCSDEKLLEINKQYLDHNYFTDIITFDNGFMQKVEGELFISIDRIKDHAKERNISFEKELYRIIIHGVLHLIGYKDKSKTDKEIMTNKENQYLALLEE